MEAHLPATVSETPSGTTSAWLDLGRGWLFQHIRDAVAVVDAASGVIHLWNPAAEQLFGYPPAEVRDQPVGRLIPSLADPARWRALADVIPPLPARDPAVELRARRAEGTEFPIEVSLSVIEAPTAERRFVVLVMRDITERRRAEEQRHRLVREQERRARAEAVQRAAQQEIAERRSTEQALLASEERLQAALATQRFLNSANKQLARSLDYDTTLYTMAHLPLPRLADMCIVDVLGEDMAIEAVAAADLDGQHATAFEQLTDAYRGESDQRDPVAEDVLSGQAQLFADIKEADWFQLAADDRHLRILRSLNIRSAMLVPLIGRGRVLGLMLLGAKPTGRYSHSDLAVAEDLARRCALALDNAQLYRTAQRAIAARDQFLSIASHELRAPLARLKAHAEVLLMAHSQNQLDPERLVWSVRRINAAADRLAALTKDLLDVSRLRVGQFPFRPRPLDLAELLRDLEPRLAEQLGDRHRLVVGITNQPCPVLVDQDRVEQILVNLLDNAAKYSPGGGDVVLNVERTSDGVLLSVRDYGIGLPPGSSDIIFEAFGRASNAEYHNLPGMGLGLHICQVIVERHGGRIWAESEGENRGTTVSIWLPFEDASPMSVPDAQLRLTNKLTVAVGYSELLASNPELPAEIRAQAHEVMTSAQEAATTLENLQGMLPLEVPRPPRYGSRRER